MTPAGAGRLAGLGAAVTVEAGLGSSIGICDGDYETVGATVTSDRDALLREADLILRLRKPPAAEIALLREGCIHISFLDPFNEPALVNSLARAGVSAVSMEMIPRTTLAQKMDALSSQASLAGYAAVIMAAECLDRVFPMMMTPAGTLTPANVFVLGAGVAGLQAIATARRLGARVTAFDIRPSSQTEVESLGAKFLKIDLGRAVQTSDGYAHELTDEQKRKQREGQAKAIAQSDVVITTAQVFGRKPPILVTRDVISRMKSGSVILDMAVETGGNVEGSRAGETVLIDGVFIVGPTNLPGRVAGHASQMYAGNLVNMIEHFWDKETKGFRLDREDDILKGSLITHRGEIVNDHVRQAYEEAES